MLLFLLGCMGIEYLPTPEVVSVEQIFMHRPGHYTIWEKPNTGGYIREFQATSIRNSCTQHSDSLVLQNYRGAEITMSNEDSYVSYLQGKLIGGYDISENDECMHLLVKIHINSLSVMQGAGWDNGKFGSGQTTPMTGN